MSYWPPLFSFKNPEYLVATAATTVLKQYMCACMCIYICSHTHALLLPLVYPVICLKHIKLYFDSVKNTTTASCIFSLLIPSVAFSTCDNLFSSEEHTLETELLYFWKRASTRLPSPTPFLATFCGQKSKTSVEDVVFFSFLLRLKIN